MAFTTWAALRTAIKDAMANHVAGSPCTGEYAIGDRRLKYRSFDELVALYEKTFVMERMESETSTRLTRNYVRFKEPV